jgi:hypothetical protein
MEPGDTTPPAKVSDVTVQLASPTSILIRWTAPGDDGVNGRAAQYDVRQAPTQLSAEEWSGAAVVSSPPTPRSAGASESLLVTNPVFGFGSHFALRTADEVPNWSEWSDPDVLLANQNPQTLMTASPPDSGSTPHHVNLSWSGSDPDGTIDHYDYIMVDHPRIKDRISGNDYERTVVVTVPEPEDPRWTTTDNTTLLFVVLADTLRVDPRGDIGAGLFDRWHTFFVRAVDNAGSPDYTPAFVSFNAFTPAPVLWLDAPAVAGSTATVSPSFVMRWNGEDPIGDGSTQNPAESRWALVEADLDPQGNAIGFPDALYDLIESAWSEWASWAAPDSSGRRAAFVDTLPVGASEQAYVFAVQGRDDGGAITPKFDASTAGRNNMGVVLVKGASRSDVQR